MKLVLDTNVLLDFFMERDPLRHKECVDLMRKVRDGEVKAVILGVVVAEMVWVMKSVYGLERKQIAELVQAVTQIKGVIKTEGCDWITAVEHYTKKKIKFIDAMIASVKQIKTKKWMIVSYDRDFDKLNVLKKTPGEIK